LNPDNIHIELGAKKFDEIEFDSLDTIYFDPPYWSEPEKNGFTSYSSSFFDKTKQVKLSKLFFKLKKERCRVLLSNSDTQLINQLYNDMELKKYLISVRRMINCNGDGRHKINELLITANCEN
jgi:DNA adenine methylase